MSQHVAMLTETIANLNGILNKISDNDTLEFDIDYRLGALDTVVDTLANEVEETIEFAEATSG